MSAMENMFSEWLQGIMDVRGLSQAELARAAGVTRTAISDILSGRRNPGSVICTQIAEALGENPENVFRMAGLLPPKPETDDIVERAKYIIGTYKNPETKQEALRYLEYLLVQEERGEYHAPKTPKPAPSQSS